MDNFFRRLKYYGIGFSIGLVFVIIIFKNKGCSWTPENRVKDAILQRIVFVDSLDLDFLNKQKINPSNLKTIISEGKVSFSDSKKTGAEKIYSFYSHLPNQKSISFCIALREKSFIVDIDFKHSQPLKYVPLVGKSKPFLFPKKTNWFSGKWESYKLEGIKSSSAPEQFTRSFFDNGYVIVPKKGVGVSESQDVFISTTSSVGPQRFKAKCRWFQEKLDILSIVKLENQ